MCKANLNRANPGATARGGAPGPTRASRQCGRRTRQRGQALLWFLATTAACCAVLALVYNVGQVTNEKEKTINAADAAALSGALVEARTLNFISYTNRAMIANEVTVAQVLSLDSWFRFNTNLADHASDIPIIGAFIEPYAATMDSLTYAVIDPLTQGTIIAADGVVMVLGAAATVANGAAVLAADDVARKIAQANSTTFTNKTTGNPRFDAAPTMVDDNGFEFAALGLNEQAWLGFTKVYCKSNSSSGNCKDNSSTDDRGGAAQVVLDSTDEFTRDRGFGVVFDQLNNLPTAVTGIEKTSKTTFLRDYDHWEASDSADIWVGVQVTIFGHTFTVAKIDTLAVGWGRADANQNGDRGQDWDWPGTGPCKQLIALGCELAYANINPNSGWSGIPEILDLTNPGKGNKNDSVPFLVAVKKSAQATLTTQRIGSGMNTVQVPGPLGSPDMKDNLQGNADQLAALSAARVFFARPDWNPADRSEGNLPRLGDHAHEYASLYNPYWQARLTNPDTIKIAGVSAKTLLYAALGRPGLNCFSDPRSCLP